MAHVDPGASDSGWRALTKAIRAGDTAAFHQFHERFSFRLYRYLLVLTRGDEGEAREVLQTTVVKVARNFAVFDEEKKLWAWLCRVARNAFLDRCRSRARDQRFVSLQAETIELAEPAVDEHRLAASLQHALAHLTEEERELMRSAYEDERPLQEIAQASGQTYKAVESRLRRLRQKVKLKLLSHLRHETQS